MSGIQSLANFKARVQALDLRVSAIHLPGEKTHAKFLEDVKFELRVLRVKLTLYRDEAELVLLQEWVSESASANRLDNIDQALAALEDVQANRIDYDDKNHIARLDAIRAKIDRLRAGRKYSEDFTHFLELEKFFAQQRRYAQQQRKYAKEIRNINRAVVASTYGGPVLGNIGRFARAMFPTLIEVSNNVSAFARAIPVIQAVFMAVPSIVNFVRHWLYRTPRHERILSTLIAAFAVIAVTISILFPFTVLGFAATMVSIGVIVDYFKTYVQARLQITELSKEIYQLEQRINVLEKYDCVLEQRERVELLKIASRYCIEDETIEFVKLDEIRATILTGSVADIEHHGLLRRIFNFDATHDLRDYLIQHQQRMLEQRYDDIKKLYELRDKRWQESINGIFVIIGAVLVAVPFPPLQLAGAAILLITSIVNICLFYDLHIKLWHAFTGHVPPTVKPNEDIEMDDLRGNPLTNNAALYQQLAPHPKQPHRMDEEFITDESPDAERKLLAHIADTPTPLASPATLRVT